MKTPLSLAIAGVIVAGMIPAAFALTTSSSSSSQGYLSPYGTFYQNGSRASTNASNSSSSSYSPYNYNYLYGSSSSSYSLMPLYQYGSSSSYNSYYGNPSTNAPGFQGLACLGMTGQDFLSCLQQYGVTSTPGSLLFENGSGSGLPSLTCDQYTGTQMSQCQQQLTDFWRSYDASLQIWWTQLQQYIQGLMANAGISPTQVGSMMGGNTSSYGYSSSSSSVMNEFAIQQAWQLCRQFDFTQQQHCMHDALTDYPRYQDWMKALQLMQSNQQTNAANLRGTVKSKSNITNNRNMQMNGSSSSMNGYGSSY